MTPTAARGLELRIGERLADLRRQNQQARQLARQTGQAVALQDIPGQAPAMNRLGAGCSFAGRCSVSLPACQQQAPPWLGTASHARLCHLESTA